ncbi:GNAT family N-acetyltransferase [uncultured Rikenella sp.]|uniref:GNAT family N-acetyltransferase n=1 Tax=uncultured Rikenella sp. TaxID=368003 RepID=UPI0025F27D5C|nr:GNAT family N-acetyltransferase [uncultured Rikenella sp.]
MPPKDTPLESARLLLRPWQLSDAPALYRYARNPRVGPLAGWPAHTSEAMSREVIRTVFNAPETYAVVLKTLGEPIGCIGLVPRGSEHYAITTDQREIGYWLGEEHWGNGYIPEAVDLLIARYTASSEISALWITTRPENLRSQRVALKCGFVRQPPFTDADGHPGELFVRQLKR